MSEESRVCPMDGNKCIMPKSKRSEGGCSGECRKIKNFGRTAPTRFTRKQLALMESDLKDSISELNKTKERLERILKIFESINLM